VLQPLCGAEDASQRRPRRPGAERRSAPPGSPRASWRRLGDDLSEWCGPPVLPWWWQSATGTAPGCWALDSAVVVRLRAEEVPCTRTRSPTLGPAPAIVATSSRLTSSRELDRNRRGPRTR